MLSAVATLVVFFSIPLGVLTAIAAILVRKYYESRKVSSEALERKVTGTILIVGSILIIVTLAIVNSNN